jgi:XTP/dITP diphosphohydrolase
MKILVATNNRHKVEEFKSLLKPEGITVLGLADMPKKLSVKETGATFLENALLKGSAAFSLFGLPTVADDSGLEVYALDNKPGVLSSRFAGEKASDADNNRKLLELMKDIPEGQRKARFVCAAVFVTGEKVTAFAEGTVDGEILFAPTGSNGFGYDPLFYYAPLKKTFAEMTMEEKNRLSHRSKAAQAMRDRIIQFKSASESPGKR